MMRDRSELERDFLITEPAAPVWRLGELDGSPLPPGAVAIGVFDGVHAGHRDLLARTVADARSRDVAGWAVTFDPDPDRVVSAHPARHLLSTADRLRLIASTGVDGVIVVPFTRELAALDHARFFEDVLFPVCPVRAIHVGSDFRLGAHGASTVPVISAWCAERGIEVFGHELVSDAGVPISATRIRDLIARGPRRGRPHGARTRPHGARTRPQRAGTGEGHGVPHRQHRGGSRLPDARRGRLRRLRLARGAAWPAAINVGVSPMFRDEARSASLEANLLGFSGDLYGADVALAFCEFLRPLRVFDSVDELIATVLGNIDYIRERYGEAGVRLRDDI